MTVTDQFTHEGTHPLTNLDYDLVVLLHEKSKELDELDRFLADAAVDREATNLLHSIRQCEARSIQQLESFLARRLHRQEPDLVGDAC